MRDEKSRVGKAKSQRRISSHKIRFPSDSLTQKELDALNGPVVIIQPAKKLSTG